MKRLSKLLMILPALMFVCGMACLAVNTVQGNGVRTASAENASFLEAQIHGWSGGGTNSLSASSEGNRITVTGEVTGATSGLTLDIDAGVTVVWEATLTGDTTISSNLLIIKGYGTFEVATDGIVSCDSDYYVAIFNEGLGSKVNVSGGTVSATSYNGIAIGNEKTNAVVNVSGGKVSATGNNGFAIYNHSGTVNISGTAEVSATGGSGNAIYNYAAGTINVLGGKVSATSGYAIYNEGHSSTVGFINVSGGEVKATSTNGRAIHNEAGGTVEVSGTATVSVANGVAIFNKDKGAVSVKDTAIITSSNTFSGTIVLNNDTVSGTLDILGGTITNTATNGKAIYPLAHEGVTIAGAVILSQSDDIDKTYDGTGAVSVTVTSPLDAYLQLQWYKDGNLIPGATSATLQVPNVSDSGVYKCQAKNVVGGYESDTATSIPITVQITVGIVPKADQGKADTPTVSKKGGDYITLAPVAGAEYSKDNGVTWQDSNTFKGLTKNTEYTFCVRLKETETKNAGAISDVLTVKTTNGGGLGRGAIIGIVAGAVVLLGGGFALYWFVFRKKKTA